MFIFIGISPIVLIVLGCVAILVLGGHVTAGLLIAMTAILAGAFVITALGIGYMRYRLTPMATSADYSVTQSRLTAQSIVTPDGIAQLMPQPTLALATPLSREQLEAAARYIVANYGEAGSLAELEAKGSDLHD